MEDLVLEQGVQRRQGPCGTARVAQAPSWTCEPTQRKTHTEKPARFAGRTCDPTENTAWSSL